MPERVVVYLRGKQIEVPAGTSAAVVAITRDVHCRTSFDGQIRAPLCGMGICFECRMKINGKPHVKSCQVICTDGIEIESDD